jgi:anti-sigma B factor antagonist
MVLRPEGEIDAMTVAPFRRALEQLATSGQIIVDLSDVEFVDSAGLGALVGGIRRIGELGGTAAIACSRSGLARVLHVTGLDKVVTVTGSLKAATAALRNDDEARSIHLQN